MAPIGHAAESGSVQSLPSAQSGLQPPVKRHAPVLVARSCASECQARHDRCRVETKGSRACDEARQRCLQVCLQKKHK